MDLKPYNQKRDFKKTAEPAGEKEHSPAGNRYLIQKHEASHLHYDFRLELDGVLKSWAVPKGPSINPADKRLAVMTEDHPLAYGDFEGTIPKGEYGGGTVMLWDTGTWEPEGDPQKDYRKGKLTFILHGDRLHGRWHLTRMRPRKGEKHENWLLIKGKDDYADTKGDQLVQHYKTSVVSQRRMEEIARGAQNENEPFTFDAPEKAKKTKMPDFIQPQLATLENNAPEGEGWLHEIKFDGYRLQFHKNGNKITCLTRRGLDWTERFSTLCDAMQNLPAKQAVLDGEVVVMNEQGVTDFKALQNSLKANRQNPMRFYAFDLLYCDGYDLRKAPLTERKEILARLLARTSQEDLHYSDHITGHGGEVYRNSCTMALEGIISKKATASYHSGRNREWLKSKCSRRQEFVIAGFQEPTRRERGIRSLLLGYYEGDKLHYAGKVGTGFSNQSGTDLREKLNKLIRKTPAYDDGVPASERKGSIWVKPQLVGEVEFTEWTEAGSLRHPSFIALREDKQARDIVREEPDDNVALSARANKPMPEIRLTSPDKVLWPSQGLTKQDLAEYYHLVADYMLPFIKDRPLSLVRCPEGRGEPCFFQRHQKKGFPKEIGSIAIEEDKGKKADYLTISNEAGLLSLVQIGALEIHPWGARNDDVDKPDTLIFDMDPGEGAEWDAIKRAALDARARLDELGLQSFLKVTGGKGLHVVVPLERRQSWVELKTLAHRFAKAMEADAPEKYIATMSKAKRVGKVFVDYLRNEKSATAIAPFSTRAKEDAPVAVPLAWEELDALPTPNHYLVSNISRRLAHLKTDPWADYFKVKQALTKSILKKYS